jgi:uncharacterized protein YecE (DUF72 family)
MASSKPAPTLTAIGLPLRGSRRVLMENLSLFEPDKPPFRQRLAARLRELAAENIFLGGSSWKYEGWLGQIYSPERYLVRGRFSQKRFEQLCLAEYAEVFPIVCGDFSFYQFPSPDYWQRLFQSAPPPFLFAFKVPEEITVRVWPTHARYGARGGQVNPTFLDAHVFQTMFLDLLAPYRDRIAVLIFEFGAFANFPLDEFLARLDAFLTALPKEDWRYAIEIRNPEFLHPHYFACLRQHGVAHVFNAWTRVPELLAQAAIASAWSAPFSVTRALLRFGRPYQQAVDRFQPYQRVQEPNEAARNGLRQIIQKSREQKKAAYIFVNNRLEGNAPGTIAAVVGVDE